MKGPQLECLHQMAALLPAPTLPYHHSMVQQSVQSVAASCCAHAAPAAASNWSPPPEPAGYCILIRKKYNTDLSQMYEQCALRHAQSQTAKYVGHIRRDTATINRSHPLTSTNRLLHCKEYMDLDTSSSEPCITAMSIMHQS